MKRFFIAICLLFMATHSFSQDYHIKEERVDSNTHRITFILNEWCVKPVALGGTRYERIDFQSSTLTEQKGWAALPFVSANILIHNRKPVACKLVEAECFEMSLRYPLVPSRGTIYRGQNPELIPYVLDPASLNDELYPKEMHEMDSPYIIRDRRFVAVRLYPFQYKPAEQKLLIFSTIVVEISELDGVGENPL